MPRQPEIPSEKASTQRQYKVTRKDLPLSCPMPEMRLWDAHPRVYLPVEKTGQFSCPYCETEYILVDRENMENHV